MLEVTAENLQPQIDFYVYGALNVAQQVLPGMLAAGTGTLIFTTGGGSVTPVPMLATTMVQAGTAC